MAGYVDDRCLRCDDKSCDDCRRRRADTVAAHKKIHQELHGKLDELVADFLAHNCKPTLGRASKSLSTTTIMELMEWSHKQTSNPTEFPQP